MAKQWYFLQARATRAVLELKVWNECRNGEESCVETLTTHTTNYAYSASRFAVYYELQK